MDKKWSCMRVRVIEAMLDEIRSLAEMEERSLLDEIRHLLRIGLEQKRQVGVHVTFAAECGGSCPVPKIPPQRATRQKGVA
jgi:predicted RNA binding protein YcfA (HicA-like mRNA interferase family)